MTTPVLSRLKDIYNSLRNQATIDDFNDGVKLPLIDLQELLEQQKITNAQLEILTGTKITLEDVKK